MRLKNCILIASLSLLGISSALAKTALIPQPQAIGWGGGNWSIPSRSQICYNPLAANSVRWLQKLIAPLSKVTTKETSNCKKASWSITLDPQFKSSDPEGYRLRISSNGVEIVSSTQVGLFYALQTLRQLLPPEVEQASKVRNYFLPFVEVEDSPLYSWRGSMLDVARSFYDVEYVKHHIDRMALFKLNRLHLHLSDDQGWRIEIKSYPNLTMHGGSGAVKNGRAGFYTQEQYQEIQKYARDRNITIIPEIEMPGHIYAALASYPELNCAGFENLSPRLATPPQLYQGVRVKWNSLCLEKLEVKKFVSAVLREVSEITDGPWIHIGGDEVDVNGYSQFISFVEGEVSRYGKITIGWEEILQASIGAKSIAQIWQKDSSATGNSKIISLCQFFYLDHSNTPAQSLPNDWCKQGGVSLEDLYGFTIKDMRNVLGIEAPIWTEFANTPQEVDDRVWPRLAAAAEVSWSLESRREISDFRSRLGAMGKRFDLMGIHFYESPTVRWTRGARSETPRSVFFGFAP